MMEKGKELQFPRRAGGSGIRKADSDEGVWKSFGFLKNRGFPLLLVFHINKIGSQINGKDERNDVEIKTERIENSG